MNLEKLQRDLKVSYNNSLASIDDKVKNLFDHIQKEWNLEPSRLTLSEMQTLCDTVVEFETQELHNEVELLLAQKEQIERKLEKKSHLLQESKYKVFDAIEIQLENNNSEALAKLHQIKLQTVDIYDLLSEMVESAIIAVLEKETHTDQTIQEVIKHITFEAINEGPLNTIRIKNILSTILASTSEIAEASPVQAHKILQPSIKGMRIGLLHAITRFKQSLVFMPTEAKHMLIDDYDNIIQDLHTIDAIFENVIKSQATSSNESIKSVLLEINTDIKYDLDELLRTSKETAQAMKEKFSNIAIQAVKKADKALHSPKAEEAKRMGKQAFGIAKNALDNALKSAKEVVEKNNKSNSD